MKVLMMVLMVGLVGCRGSGVDFTNYAVSGYNTIDTIGIIDDVLINKPSLVLVMIGTNDALNSKKQVSISDYKKNLNMMVLAILASGAEIVLMTIPPAISEYVLERHSSKSYSKFGGVNEIIGAFNEVIERVAIDNDTYLYDVNGLVMDNGGVSKSINSVLRNEDNSGVNDGVHLTSEGYYYIAKGLCNIIISKGLDYSNTSTVGDSLTLGFNEPTNYTSYLKNMLIQRVKNNQCSLAHVKSR